MPQQERRGDARFSVDRPAKVRCPHTGRYLPGRTSNVSASGALLVLRRGTMLKPGEPLRLGIAWTQQQAVLPQSSLIDATVVRCIGVGEEQRVAVSFNNRQALALTA